ncbi:ATP-binding protein [Pedobacter aquatilis]|uniref:ATP-binding protein n=1 Tax=Pedobacter aquatilis TaxID=351343 RepID=UPI00292E37B2|nr:ATP-binding protein [Pedobacter aquatilis]
MNKNATLGAHYPLNATEIVNLLTDGPQATVIFSSRDLHIGFINNAMLALWNKVGLAPGLTLTEAAPEFDSFIPILQKVWDTGRAFVAINTFADVVHDTKLVSTPFDFEYKPILDSEGKTIAIINSAVKVTDRMIIAEDLEKMAAVEHELNISLKGSNEKLESLNEEYMATIQELNDLTQQLGKVNEEYTASNEELIATLEEVAILNQQLTKANLALNTLIGDLEINKAQLNNALQAANLGSYDLDLQTLKMDCSDQCKINFGIPVSEKFDFEDLLLAITPEFRDVVQSRVRESIESNTPYNMEYQINRPDGSVHWIQANGSPQYTTDGQPKKMVGVTQLITEKKNYQAKKDEFLSVASHELKTPITVLKANLQLLDKLKPQIESPMVVKLIDSCGRSMERINLMLVELLDVGKYADGKIELRLSRFNVKDLLANSILHISPENQAKLIIEPVDIEVQADENRLEQVLINFVNNAFKYAPSGEQVIISAKQVDHHLLVSVSDFGEGIPKDHIHRLFDRYWQGDKKQQNNTGLGLGLYICAEIINRHHGQLGVESEQGHGSTFWFKVPLEQ